MTKPLTSAPLEIVNKRGLHARASAALARLAGTFTSSVKVSKNGESVIATSIMGLMMLGAARGEHVTLKAEGADAAEALKAITDLITDGFGETD